MASDGALGVDVHGPDKKRQKLAKLTGLGFARDLAEVIVETLGMDPIGQSAHAAIAETLSGEGLVDLASVRTVAGEVAVNARLADADSEAAIKSLRALAPNLKALQALKLAKAACAPTVQPADELGEDASPRLEKKRRTNEEMAKALVQPATLLPAVTPNAKSMPCPPTRSMPLVSPRGLSGLIFPTRTLFG
ncbi:hypothetical protein VOLCADRAFT_105345 [Volvox carteri f. nagariensis]|uniref:Uncharacterized protein n=1 Tax=Volvox carteri f. nagariensis TaxID=3068 RepID=D8U091_VOLCA|nr:uncharacterized protein VOLCADRAFT_105345 [Volvox carteri f. nagariensis]EFJ46821.1 hypothetical protein VOLCADRAFT_105345 [Volvox carteri f. nagariensis]|eukprot:XP_002952030.1 hypothetical protein VOLCADRAFT_105345 [Volvox carteri f. nagariensis]